MLQNFTHTVGSCRGSHCHVCNYSEAVTFWLGNICQRHATRLVRRNKLNFDKCWIDLFPSSSSHERERVTTPSVVSTNLSLLWRQAWVREQWIYDFIYLKPFGRTRDEWQSRGLISDIFPFWWNISIRILSIYLLLMIALWRINGKVEIWKRHWDYKEFFTEKIRKWFVLFWTVLKNSFELGSWNSENRRLLWKILIQLLRIYKWKEDFKRLAYLNWNPKIYSLIIMS